MLEYEYFKHLNYLFDDLQQLLNNGVNPTSQSYQDKLEEIRSTPIYKFMDIEHVILMFINKKLWIGKVNTWEDVYENIILKQNFVHRLDTGLCKVNVDSVRDNFFGQCWTTLLESDAMWRIYAPHKGRYKFAVRIKTTVGKLLDAAYVNDSCMANTYIGSVSYLDNKGINRILSQYNKNGLDLKTDMREFSNLLLLKRREFQHEQEVRLIISQDTSFTADHLEYTIDPDMFIDEVTLDPRIVADSKEYKKYVRKLTRNGVPKSKINRSCLYDLPSPIDIVIR